MIYMISDQPPEYEQRSGAEAAAAEPEAPPVQMFLPPQVAIAMKFVEHCNQYMGVRNYMRGCQEHGNMEAVIKRVSLPLEQEQAFRLACQCLGKYFASGVRINYGGAGPGVSGQQSGVSGTSRIAEHPGAVKPTH